MSEKERDTFSIVVLGTADLLKKNLISVILGKDVFAQRISDFETHGNDTYKVTFTPNFFEASEDIKQLLSSEQHDMCLLVVEDGFTTQEVWHQIEKLHKITKKPTEDFIVVLPLRCKSESYPFKCYTMERLFSELRKPAEYRKWMSYQRSADQTRPQTSRTGGRYSQDHFTDNKKSFKENDSDTKVNLVLLGMSGTGKSASGNTILGRTQFVSKASSMPFTTECQAAENVINGTRVRVIDTPDIFNDGIKSSVKNHHVTQCRQLCQSDPCVYLLVIQVGRFTDDERDILRKVEAAFGPRAKDQTIILFTHGEELQRAQMSFVDFLQHCPPDLKNIVEQCGRRYVVFESKASHQHQVAALMRTVNMMLNKW